MSFHTHLGSTFQSPTATTIANKENFKQCKHKTKILSTTTLHVSVHFSYTIYFHISQGPYYYQIVEPLSHQWKLNFWKIHTRNIKQSNWYKFQIISDTTNTFLVSKPLQQQQFLSHHCCHISIIQTPWNHPPTKKSVSTDMIRWSVCQHQSPRFNCCQIYPTPSISDSSPKLCHNYLYSILSIELSLIPMKNRKKLELSLNVINTPAILL